MIPRLRALAEDVATRSEEMKVNWTKLDLRMLDNATRTQFI
jgi:hypothetical protein